MSTRITHQADGTARGQTQQNTANSIIDLRKQPAHTPKQAEPAKPDCCGQPPVPARQKNAREYLAGRSPGVMQSYAPNAAASPVEGWVEDDETVHRLAHWREEATHQAIRFHHYRSGVGFCQETADGYPPHDCSHACQLRNREESIVLLSCHF